MSKIYDISQTLSAKTPVWPGDTAFQAERTWQRDDTCPVNVSKITMSSHAGTHADAPLHYDNAGAAIDAVALTPYIGPCIVVDVVGVSPLIRVEDVEDQIPNKVERVLFKMFEVYPTHVWPENFPALSAELIPFLADKGCLLVGIESPSVDPETSKEIPCHKQIEYYNLAILEGLVLTEVPAGVYDLTALPLKMEGVDASPVRAILRDIQDA